MIELPLISLRVKEVLDGTDAILYSLSEVNPFNAVPLAIYFSVSPTLNPCAEDAVIVAP